MTCACSCSSSTTRTLARWLSAFAMPHRPKSLERQFDPEVRPLPDVAGDAYPAAVLFHHALGDGQSEPGAAFLGRIVGVENVGQCLGLDPLAGVDHLQDRPVVLPAGREDD